MADGILGDLESGLKSVLPYALPAALGASLGGPMGGLAGVAVAQPDPDEQLRRQKEQLDIESEQAGLNQAALQQQAEQHLYSNPDFQQYLAKTMGIDPSHVPNLTGLPIGDVNKFLESIQKSRAAGNKLSNVHQLLDGSWAGTNEFGEDVPLSGTPTAVIAERERGKAEGERQQTNITATDTRQKTSIAATDKRAADALAARQTQQQETNIQNVIKAAPAAYRQLQPVYDRFGTLAGDKGYYDYLVNKLSAIPGETMEDAQRRASVEAKYQPKDSIPSGYVSTGRKTKDGKPAYYNPTAKKWWSPD